MWTPGKKSRARRWRIDSKTKTNHRWITSLRLMQRLTMPTCPALNISNNIISKDLTKALLEQIMNVSFLVSLYLWFLEEKMVCDQHPDPKTTAEGPVEKGRYDLLVGDVLPVFFYHYHLFSIDILPAVLEALSQRRHHVLVVFHQGSEDRGSLTPWWKYGAGHLLENGGVLRHVVQIQKFREVIEDVERSDV